MYVYVLSLRQPRVTYWAGGGVAQTLLAPKTWPEVKGQTPHPLPVAPFIWNDMNAQTVNSRL